MFFLLFFSSPHILGTLSVRGKHSRVKYEHIHSSQIVFTFLSSILFLLDIKLLTAGANWLVYYGFYITFLYLLPRDTTRLIENGLQWHRVNYIIHANRKWETSYFIIKMVYHIGETLLCSYKKVKYIVNLSTECSDPRIFPCTVRYHVWCIRMSAWLPSLDLHTYGLLSDQSRMYLQLCLALFISTWCERKKMFWAT